MTECLSQGHSFDYGAPLIDPLGHYNSERCFLSWTQYLRCAPICVSHAIVESIVGCTMLCVQPERLKVDEDQTNLQMMRR